MNLGGGIISIHAPTNGATNCTACRYLNIADFNPRSDERSDPASMCDIFAIFISIHAPTNGATKICVFACNCECISIHAPTNGATNFCSGDLKVSRISIHAPTNGATTQQVINSEFFIISIHAPTNGATQASLTAIKLLFYFNPRSDERSDMDLVTFEGVRYIIISIHAPTNGATLSAPICSRSIRFQSTLRRTERPSILRCCQQLTHFNPRSDERSDNSCKSSLKSFMYFNPRSDERSDMMSGAISNLTSRISIHAPTNGAT